MVGILGTVGFRPDFTQQSPLKLFSQLILWGIGLVAFPAIGVGLWFPPTWVRWLLLGFAAIVITLGHVHVGPWPHALTSGFGCLAVMVSTGVLLLTISRLGHIFTERRRFSSVVWSSAGISLCGLNLITWHCSVSDPYHLMVGHWGAAAVVFLLGLGIAFLARREPHEEPHSDAVL